MREAAPVWEAQRRAERHGTGEDVAGVMLALMSNGFVVVDVDADARLK
jgi:hypothetical protein